MNVEHNSMKHLSRLDNLQEEEDENSINGIDNNVYLKFEALKRKRAASWQALRAPRRSCLRPWGRLQASNEPSCSCFSRRLCICSWNCPCGILAKSLWASSWSIWSWLYWDRCRRSRPWRMCPQRTDPYHQNPTCFTPFSIQYLFNILCMQEII